MDVLWMQQAKCKNNTDIEFFPDHGENGTEAKRFCAGCPVIEQCLEYATVNSIDYGVWGGLSAIQRMTIRRRKGRQSWTSGTTLYK